MQFLKSTINPTELSLRVKGVIILLIPAIASVVQNAGFIVPEGDLTAVVEAVFLVVGFVMFIVGQKRANVLK